MSFFPPRKRFESLKIVRSNVIRLGLSSAVHPLREQELRLGNKKVLLFMLLVGGASRVVNGAYGVVVRLKHVRLDSTLKILNGLPMVAVFPEKLRMLKLRSSIM
jgi:hypothetical protein